MTDTAARALGGLNRVPARGRDKTFDRYYDEKFGNDRDEGDNEELRQAAWSTWKTCAPSGSNRPTGVDRRATEDEELARAIALSVTDHQGQIGCAIDLTEDSDDDEVQRVIAMSEEDARAPKRARREETPEEERKMLAEAMAASLAQDGAKGAPTTEDDEPTEIPPPKSKQSSNARSGEASIPPKAGQNGHTSTNGTGPSAPAPRMQMGGPLGDRAQMEQERLARQAARAQPTNDSVDRPSRQPPKVYVTGNVRTMADIKASASAPPTLPVSSSSIPANPYHSFQSSKGFPSDAGGEYYPDGEIRHTALTIGKPATERTFSPQQIMGNTSQIALIVMSSFVLDDEWIESFLPPAESVPRVVIRPHPKEYHPAWNGKVQIQTNGEVRCYPKMVGDWGSAHMKFAWIFYKTGRLRVVISTANMVPYDWEWIENTIFIQDVLPLSPARASGSSPLASHDFPSRFRWLFAHLKVHKALRFLVDKHPQGANIPFNPTEGFDDMDRYDWSQVKVKLLMSVPDTYTGAAADDFGICRLGKILNEEGWKPQGGEIVKAEFQGSSLGTFTLDWFDAFYQYCSGKISANLINRPKPNAWPPIKIVFPTLATVDASVLGRDGGGTMFCGKSFNTVTRPLFHDANSKRGGVLMHSKVLLGIFEPKPDTLGFAKSPSGKSKRKASQMEDENSGVGGWAYIGSHNFSPSAWGKVNLKKAVPTLSISNYELGIVFPLPRDNVQKVADAIAPYQRPPRPYSASDAPWDQSIREEH